MKHRFKHENGKTKAPYIIYPNEVRDEIYSKLNKDNDIEPPELDEEAKKKHAQFAFSLVAKNIKCPTCGQLQCVCHIPFI